MMDGGSFRLCSSFLLLCICTYVKCLDSSGFNALRELQQKRIIEPLCNCSGRLIPKVKDVHDVLWVLSGIVEQAQMKAAVNVELRHKNATKGVLPETARVRMAFGQAFFLDKMHQIIPSIEQVHNTITRLRLLNLPQDISFEADQRSVESFMQDMMEDCPYHSTADLYKNLTDEVTDAAHFMADVEMDEGLAEDNLLGIRMMVVEMNNRTDKFGRLLKNLKSLPCPEPAVEETGDKKARVRSFGEEQLDCSCVEILVPQAQNLTDLISWVLHVLKETQAHAMLTISDSPTGRARAAPGSEEYFRLEYFNRTFLGVDFYASFFEETETPTTLLSRSASDSGEGCPLSELLKYQEKLEVKMTDALHYKEDVKGDAVIAKHMLNMINDSIDELSVKLKEYEDFTTALKNRNC